MKYQLILIMIVFSLFPGCVNYQVPLANHEHPANPDSAVTSGAEQPNLLEVDKSSLPESSVQMQDHKMNHMN